MPETAFIVRFDGPIFADGHKMAVEEFASSALAIAHLFERANHLLNGDRASVRVMIDVDVEQRCFQFGMEVVQSILDKAKALFTEENIKTAKQIGEAIGVVAGVGISLFAALKKLRGKQPTTKMVVRDGKNVVQINAPGATFHMSPDAAKLLTDSTCVRDAKGAVEPATRPGYEKVEFQERGGTPVEEISNEEARLIQDTPLPAAPPAATFRESKMRAEVAIRRAGYMGSAKWTIQHEKAREMTMADEQWLADFQSNRVSAPPGSLLDVDIVVSPFEVDANGNPVEEPSYTITKVYGVKPPPSSPTLPLSLIKDRGEQTAKPRRPPLKRPRLPLR